MQRETFAKLIRTWPDMFTLSLTRKGQYVARLDGRLEKKFYALTKRVDDRCFAFWNALLALRHISGKRIHHRRLASDISILSSEQTEREALTNLEKIGGVAVLPHLINCALNFEQALGPELEIIGRYGSGAYLNRIGTDDIFTEKTAAAKRLGAKISKWLMEIAKKPSTKPALHKGSMNLDFVYLGERIAASLPWLAIEFARRHVAAHHTPPTKAELRAQFASQYPELKEPTKPKEKKARDAFWASIYRNSGLSALDSAKSWDEEKKKRAKPCVKAQHARS